MTESHLGHRHQRDLAGYPPESLATILGDLTYDGLAAYLEALAAKLERDAAADEGRRRPKLAARLGAAAAAQRQAAAEIRAAWEVCQPFMRDDAHL